MITRFFVNFQRINFLEVFRDLMCTLRSFNDHSNQLYTFICFRFLLAVTTLVCLVNVNGQSNPFFNLDDLNLNFDFSNFGTPAARTPVLTKPAAGDKELTSAHLDGITTQFANMFNDQVRYLLSF